MKTAILSLIALAMFGSVANAQCRNGTCQIRGNNAVQVRANPVAVNNAVVYTYPTTYQYPTQEILVQQVAIPVAIPVLVPSWQYTYMPACAAPQVPGMQQPAFGAANDSERIKQLARALMAEMNKQSAPDGSSGAQDDGPPVAIDFPAQANFVNVLSNRCAECHTGANAKAGVMIFSSLGAFNPKVDRQRIMKAVEDGRMPPKAVNDPNFRLTPGEVAILRDAFR